MRVRRMKSRRVSDRKRRMPDRDAALQVVVSFREEPVETVVQDAELLELQVGQLQDIGDVLDVAARVDHQRRVPVDDRIVGPRIGQRVAQRLVDLLVRERVGSVLLGQQRGDLVLVRVHPLGNGLVDLAQAERRIGLDRRPVGVGLDHRLLQALRDLAREPLRVHGQRHAVDLELVVRDQVEQRRLLEGDLVGQRDRADVEDLDHGLHHDGGRRSTRPRSGAARWSRGCRWARRAASSAPASAGTERASG